MADTTIDTVAIEFEGNVEDFSTSVDKLISFMNNLKKSTKEGTEQLSRLSSSVKNINDNTKNLEKQSKETKKSTMNWAKYGVAITAAALGIGKATKSSSEALATQIRFNSVFNTTEGQLQQATTWVDNFTDALYLDKQEVQGAITTFKQLTTNMGIPNDTANLMSKNLTQIGYDLAAFTNIPVSEVFTALTSGIGGEAEAMKRFGVMLNEATLQNTLYANGINRTVSELSSAQRAELMYYQIMQATTAQQGYAAKTLMQPANALVIVKTQFTNLARAIGNIFLPILMAMIPYVIAITQLLTELAQAIANFFGFKIDFNAPKIETDLGGISSGIGDIGDTAGDTGKKIQNMLRDFDELHVVNFDNGTSGGSGSGIGAGAGAGGSLGLPLQDYDALAGLQDEISKKVEKIKNFIKEMKDYIVAIGFALAGFALGKFIQDLAKGTGLAKLLKKNLFALGTAFIAGGGYLIGSAFFDMYENGLTLNNMIKLIIGSMITFTGVYMVLTKLKSVGLYQKLFGSTNLLKATSGVTLGIVALILAVTLFAKAAKGGEEGANAVALGLTAMGIAAGIFFLAGSPALALIVAIAAAGVLLVGTIQTIIQAFQHLSDSSVEIKSPFENISNDIKWLTDTLSGAADSITSDFETISSSANTEFSSVGNSVGSTVTGIDTSLNTDLQKVLEMSGMSIEEYNKNVSSSFGDTGTSVNGTVSNIDQYLNEDLVKYLEASGVDIEEYKDKLQKEFGETDINTSTTINSIKQSLDSLNPEIQKNEETFGNLNTTTQGILEEVDKEVSNKTGSMATSFKDMADKAKEYSGNTKTALEGINKTEIKKPHFSWKSTVQEGLSVALKGVLSAFGMATALPALNIQWFATGGFPEKGELFVANENAPEMIGKMGNRNVVANNQQITQGIASAVYDAIVDANLGGDSGDTYVYVGDRQITDVITKRQKRNNDKFGR